MKNQRISEVKSGMLIRWVGAAGDHQKNPFLGVIGSSRAAPNSLFGDFTAEWNIIWLVERHEPGWESDSWVMNYCRIPIE